MTGDSRPERDLLGDPWTEAKDPRGRKRHQRTKETAEKVAVLRGTGMDVASIAARVQLSEPTLRKYYFRELERGPDLALAMVDEAMYAKACEGNAAAANYIRKRFETGQAAVPIRRRPGPLLEPKLGKKEQAADDAKTAHEGTSWGSILN